MCRMPVGPIPEELSNLEELEQLFLADNALEGVPTIHHIYHVDILFLRTQRGFQDLVRVYRYA